MTPARRTEKDVARDLLGNCHAEANVVVAPQYERAENEGRTLVQNALPATGDIVVTDTELRFCLEPLRSPHRTRALAALCGRLNETATRFPGAGLRLHFALQPEPPPASRFPTQDHRQTPPKRLDRTGRARARSGGLVS